MDSITLLPDFDESQEEVEKLFAESIASDEPLNIEIPIAGRVYFTDTEHLVGQFLHAAYIGEILAGECSQFECHVSSAQDGYASVFFDVVPKHLESFAEKFWEAILGFMSERLLNHFDHHEEYAAETVSEMWAEGWDFLEKPELAIHTLEIVEHAQEIAALFGDDEDEDDEDDEAR